MKTDIPKTMQAVAVTRYGTQLEFIEAPVPLPRPDEVLIKVHASGLCSTDLHLLNGRQPLGNLPRILGHEIAGEILAPGSNVTDWQEGNRVVVAIDEICGQCIHCITGQPQRCSNKTRIGFERDGGHAEFVVVPAANLVLLPENISYKDASILPDAMACMYHSLINQGQLRINQKIVILGIGGLGIHGVQIARNAGAEVVATSRRAHRLQAAEEYGAIAVNPNKDDLAKVVSEISDGAGADIVADCIGTVASIKEGLALLRPGGKLLVIAYIDQIFEIPSIPLFSMEKEIIGCRGSSKLELTNVVNLVAQGKLKSMIGAEFPLSHIRQAVELLEAGDVLGRIVLVR